MDVLVVYESLFGNTHEIAKAISTGIRRSRPDAEVRCLRVTEARPDVAGSVDLLVVGGPTHMRGMSSRLTRRMGVAAEERAAAEGGQTHPLEPGAEGQGVRNFLAALPKGRAGSRAAAFDTRGDARMAGGAAPGIARRLRHHGYSLAAEPEGFFIEDTAGPLRAGEVERAAAWGAQLVR